MKMTKKEFANITQKEFKLIEIMHNNKLYLTDEVEQYVNDFYKEYEKHKKAYIVPDFDNGSILPRAQRELKDIHNDICRISAPERNPQYPLLCEKQLFRYIQTFENHIIQAIKQNDGTQNHLDVLSKIIKFKSDHGDLS